MQRFVILTGAREASHLETFVRTQAPQAAVTAVIDRDGLAQALASDNSSLRLIAFCTAVIVKPAQLAALNLTPYNIHPGPAEYPGVLPEYFACADGAAFYGATAHEIWPAIDAGPIVGQERFAIRPLMGVVDIALPAFQSSLRLFAQIVRHCARTEAPMPRLKQCRWTRPALTNKDARARFGDPMVLPQFVAARRAA